MIHCDTTCSSGNDNDQMPSWTPESRHGQSVQWPQIGYLIPHFILFDGVARRVEKKKCIEKFIFIVRLQNIQVGM